MKQIKYKTVNQAIKEGRRLKIVSGQHICGCRMFFCVACNRIFCSSCDTIGGKTRLCCGYAIDTYYADNEKKLEKRDAIKREMAKRPQKSIRYKFRVAIEEIPCENVL